MNENTGGQTDVAALSAGVIAGAVVQYTSPGQYDWLNVVMGITLSMVVATYVWEHKRMWWKSVAVGCVLNQRARGGEVLTIGKTR